MRKHPKAKGDLMIVSLSCEIDRSMSNSGFSQFVPRVTRQRRCTWSPIHGTRAVESDHHRWRIASTRLGSALNRRQYTCKQCHEDDDELRICNWPPLCQNPKKAPISCRLNNMPKPLSFCVRRGSSDTSRSCCARTYFFILLDLGDTWHASILLSSAMRGKVWR